MTTTTDAAALLAAILERPEDDGLRLVFADFLDEHGEPERAEFIRVQVELAGRESAHLPADDPCTCHLRPIPTGDYCGACQRRSVPIIALRRRERELWKALTIHREFAPLCPTGISDSPEFVTGKNGENKYFVRRGFISHAAAPLDVLIPPCESCYDGWVGSEFDTKCPACHGTGLTTGILAALLEREPVTSVRATDREPRRSDTSKGERFIWFHTDSEERGGVHPSNRAGLPVVLFDLLESSETAGSHWKQQFGRYSDKWYPFADAAYAALSDAIIALAREQRGG